MLARSAASVKIQSSLRFVFLVLVGGGGRGGCRFVGNPFRGHSGPDEEEMTALISVGSMVCTAPCHRSRMNGQ